MEPRTNCRKVAPVVFEAMLGLMRSGTAVAILEHW